MKVYFCEMLCLEYRDLGVSLRRFPFYSTAVQLDFQGLLTALTTQDLTSKVHDSVYDWPNRGRFFPAGSFHDPL